MNKNIQRLEQQTKGSGGQSTAVQYDAQKIGGALSQIFQAINHLRPERQQSMLLVLRDKVLAGDMTGVTDSYLYNMLDGARQEILEAWSSLFDPSSKSNGDDTVMVETALEAIESRMEEITPAVRNVSSNTALPIAYAQKREANSDSYPSLSELQIAHFAKAGMDVRNPVALANVYARQYRLGFGDAVHLAWLVNNAEPSLEVINVLNARRHFV